MIVVKTKYLPKIWNGKAIFPFIVIRKGVKNEANVFMHEKIHYEQQKEMLVVFAYLWYWVEYLIRVLRYLDYKKAYYNHSMEREAFENETNMGYIVTRRRFSFIMYLV